MHRLTHKRHGFATLSLNIATPSAMATGHPTSLMVEVDQVTLNASGVNNPIAWTSANSD